MKIISLISRISLMGLCLIPRQVIAQTLPLNSNLINFNSTPGETFLIESNARQDYIPLSLQFETQENLAYCGVASIVMVLNALSIPAPKAPEWRTYHRFTQQNLFDNSKTQAVMTSEMVAQGGMTLQQLGELLASYPINVNVYYGSDVSLQEFRQRIIDNLKQPNNFVLINYLRHTIGQEKGGHISPIAAYHKESDRFLILDVSRYKYPPVWVKAEDLWKAINTIDSASNKTRGFVLVSSQ
ncbi:phytochelatin synthase family protein [Crocosphaera sp. UHCC 0190]|uniref:phytochelatin synthase family protein n=1 Tax=Crocosphaera sp. UHCC 0190 TaxID=3110246 RepID=UPI002B1EA51F|nr:phytochelatin synthase family protein [Crocosphaera sp. UHCC 0190]MEA5508793.1 phytochelatin synthase family protein [Crocosphaera sp. UHCC 0190]